MSAKKAFTTGSEREAPSSRTPPYHSEISDEYLVALQKFVDLGKPEGFELTPIGDAGW